MSAHADWIPLFNACAITPEDLDWAELAGLISPDEFAAMLTSQPTPDGVVLLLAMRSDAALRATQLAQLAARRDQSLREATTTS